MFPSSSNYLHNHTQGFQLFANCKLLFVCGSFRVSKPEPNQSNAPPENSNQATVGTWRSSCRQLRCAYFDQMYLSLGLRLYDRSSPRICANCPDFFASSSYIIRGTTNRKESANFIRAKIPIRSGRMAARRQSLSRITKGKCFN